MKLPEFDTYCNNTTAVNALRFELDGLVTGPNGIRQGVTVWFSYKTPVAFQVGFGDCVVRQNTWGPTTGKHINAIDGGTREAKAARLTSDGFQAALEAILDNN